MDLSQAFGCHFAPYTRRMPVISEGKAQEAASRHTPVQPPADAVPLATVVKREGQPKQLGTRVVFVPPAEKRPMRHITQAPVPPPSLP